MVPNRNGMTALVDAMAFLVIMLIVLSLSISHITPEEGRSSADGIMDVLISVEVRMSDLTDLDDDSKVRLTDLVAYDMVNGTDRSFSYVEEVMDSFARGSGYRLMLEFGDLKALIGDPDMEGSSGSVSDVFVSTGGTLHMDLVLSS